VDDLINMTQPVPPLLKYLEDRGITLKDMIDTALEFYVPTQRRNQRKAIQLLTEEFLDILQDVNISTMEVAAFRAKKTPKQEKFQD
jgi:hypothetical protein